MSETCVCEHPRDVHDNIGCARCFNVLVVCRGFVAKPAVERNRFTAVMEELTGGVPPIKKPPPDVVMRPTAPQLFETIIRMEPGGTITPCTKCGTSAFTPLPNGRRVSLSRVSASFSDLPVRRSIDDVPLRMSEMRNSQPSHDPSVRRESALPRSASSEERSWSTPESEPGTCPARCRNIPMGWRSEMKVEVSELHELVELSSTGPKMRLALLELIKRRETDGPIAMRLPCPACGGLHIDEGEFATKPHHTHACQYCGLVWRPAIVNTVGVQFLPGYKSKP